MVNRGLLILDIRVLEVLELNEDLNQEPKHGRRRGNEESFRLDTNDGQLDGFLISMAR